MKSNLKTLFGLLLTLFIVFTVLNDGYADTTKRGGDLKFGTPFFPRTFNSALESGTPTMVPGSMIFASLLEFDDKWQPHPYFAKSWKISEDGLSYTFNLIETATFHDGKPITSEDVAFSFNIIKKNHPFGVAMFKAVNRVDTPDAHTAVFKLAQPHPALLYCLSPPLFPILPKHVYNEKDHGPIRKNPANLKPVGSGPWKLTDFKTQDEYTLERYDKYFRAGRPYLDRIIVKRIKEQNALAIGLQKGDFDYTSHFIQLQSIPRLKKDKHLKVTKKGYEAIGAQTYLEFNLRKKPLSDLRVRQAIYHAIDRDFITKKLQQERTVGMTGPLTHTSPFYAKDVTQYELNLDKANKILDEAGYKKNTDGVRFSLVLDWIPPRTDMRPVAEWLKQQVLEIGIDIKLNVVDAPTWARRMMKWEHDMTITGAFSYPDPVIGIHRLYICDNIKHVIFTNTSGYCNPEADELLASAAVEMDLGKRKKLYADWQQILAKELPGAWIYEQAYFTVFNNDLRNVPLSIWGVYAPFDNVYWKDGRSSN